MRKFTGPSNRPKGGHDTQRSVNLYPVRGEVGGGKSLEHLASVPGLEVFSVPVLYYLSWPYPQEVDEEAAIGLAVPLTGRLWGWPDDAADIGLAVPLAGTLVAVLRSHDQVTPESADVGLATPLAGTLVTVLRTHDQVTPESADIGLAIPLAGTLVVVLVPYDQVTPESADIGLAIPLPGTLT